ncbi:uncharacterized protein CTHT_0036430 [Thermochaetoides thermophila DSM 1495]|uniref:Uncharacterized protein n=1 Tax=Chaetomium thermophilum (strain DSM 1495 / CBS 144.50 / IMI 039719) TaxID=759272 RepID=G0S7D1_CHATD|nr:hypothetical protein CTHT_0036430 [Thermochaetoides thermophila DSM 1495]EGS21775.1 hypothetical protein CTHT_0036430 [Thermochaetoides thermophila DSM 1495]
MLPNQENWKWCSKCAVLFYTGNAPCRANNGTHDLSGSSNYFIPINENAPGQKGWRWCKKCQVLSWVGNEIGSCQADGNHDISESSEYHVLLASDDDKEGWKADMKQYRKCQGLTYMDGEKKECVGGGHHDFSESGWYVLCSNGEPRSQAEIGHNQWHWCKDHQLLCHDGNTSCAAGVVHISVGSSNYKLKVALKGPTPNIQTGWH